MVKLVAEKRQVFGKKLKTARESGKMPAVAYGRKDLPLPIFVAPKEFKKAFDQVGESAVLTLDIAGEEKDVLIQSVVYHPVSGDPLHADFYVIEKGKALQVDVELEFTGVSEAVKSMGGTLVKVLHKLEVEALPKDLPHTLTVDISLLKDLESQVLVKDIAVPAGVTVLNGPEEVVAAIAVAKEEKEETPVDLSSIEVMEKGKKDEETEAGGEEAAKKPEKE